MLQLVGSHQAEIEKLFDGQTSYAGQSPVYEFPLVVLGFTNRCGSNLLADYLHITGKFGGLYEHLNGFAVRQMVSETKASTFPDHISALVKKHKNGREIYGVKASWDQLLMLKRWNVDKMFSSIRVLHIEREDLLSQAVSFAIADQTKQWLSTQPSSGRVPTFNFDDVMGRIEGIGNGNKLIGQICSIFDLDYHHTTYEKLTNNPVKEITEIHRWLGLPTTGINLGKTRLAKQANETNEIFKEQFRQDAMLRFVTKDKAI